jgi:putative endonuclease
MTIQEDRALNCITPKLLDRPPSRTMTVRRTQASAMSTERAYWVYMLASRLGGTLYIGVTNNLARRVYEHRSGLVDGFTKDYAIHRLVYFEQHTDVEAAIRREKRLKKWNRAWKVRLIERFNPNWDDLFPQIASP